MTDIRHSGGQVSLFALSLLGAAIAIYLTAVHYENVPLVCSTSGLIDCSRVLSSNYSVVPGTAIPITIPGLFWCVVSAILAFVGWRVAPEQRNVRIAEFAWSLLGMLTVFYLVYVEIVRLHTICAWCTALHVIILVMLL
ncbi:MAG: vitamin K epoxide reductase family protein, partial [Chloroflexi bacterium]|nr:vitamin K epoxide reductase family protein [Chloroflexota bacterium]